MHQMQSNINRLFVKIFFLAFVVSLTSCGGSDGEGDSGDSLPEPQNPSSNPVSNPEPTPVPTPDPTPISVANEDSYFIERNKSLNVNAQSGLITNDELVTDSQAEILLVMPPTSSSEFKVNPDGSFLYVHNGDDAASDSFTYKINDAMNESNIATVRLVITETAVTQKACLDTPLDTDLNGNLNDFVNTSLSVSSFKQVGQEPNGSVLLDPTTGEFIYTPSLGMKGLDSFAYEITDQSGTKANGTIEIIVAKIRIMPLGDSITKGVTIGLSSSVEDSNPPNERKMIAYRAKLYEDLVSKGYKIDFVGSLSHGLGASQSIGDPDHEGHSGFKDEEVASAVFGWLDKSPADIVLLHIGNNGLNRQGGTSSSDVERILDEIDRWEAQTSTPIAVFLAYIIEKKDTANNNAIPNPRVKEFNTNLETLVLGPGGNGGGRVDAGDDIIMVNQQDALSYPDDLSEDRVHPLPVGYDKMASTWLEALESSQKLPTCTSSN